MLAIELIFIATLTTIIFLEAKYTSHIIQAERRQQMLDDRSIGCHTSQGWTGYSVICLGARNWTQIENLLNTQYDRYEVILIIDAEICGHMFSEIISRYRLIKLNSPKIKTDAEVVIKSLYRSAQRRYRHLALLDIAQNVDTHETLNCALTVASYNYVIPLKDNLLLRPHAIESIAIKLSDTADCNIELLQSLSEPPCQIFRYESVIEKGGFTTNLPHKISDSNILYTYETYLCRQENQQLPNKKQENRQTQKTERAIIWQLMGGIAMLGGLAFVTINPMAIGSAEGMLIATLATIITLKTIARYQIAASGIAKCSLRAMLCYFRRIVAFFSGRKFNVS